MELETLIIACENEAFAYSQLKVFKGKTDIRRIEITKNIFLELTEVVHSTEKENTTHSRKRLILTEVNRVDPVAGKSSLCNLLIAGE